MKKQLTFFNSSIESLSQRISSGEISPVELVEASLSRIKELNQDYNAFITVTENSAIQEAKQAAREISEKKYRGPLHGIPFGLKDLIYVKGVKSTSGSKILSDFVPDYDSTVVKKLRKKLIVWDLIYLSESRLNKYVRYLFAFQFFLL